MTALSNAVYVCVCVYGLDVLGIKSRRGRDFLHSSRPALGPTHNMYHITYLVFFPGVKRPGRSINHPPHLEQRLNEEQSYTYVSPVDLHGLL